MNSRAILHLRTRASLSAADSGVIQRLREFCSRITPAWEWSADGVFLDLTGTDRLYGRGLDGLTRVCRDARDHFDLRCAGSGPTSLAARLASLAAGRSSGTRVLAVSSGSVAAFLALFPIDLLPARSAQTNRLRSLGVRTLGDLQCLPRPLLKAVFGPVGPRLADEAWGLASRPLSGGEEPRGGSVLIAGVRLSRPLTSLAGISSLQRALAMRALTACPGGPAGRERWILIARWADGGSASAVRAGSGTDGTLADWLGLMERLWSRLPDRRRGPVRLELRAAGRSVTGPRQGNLFPGQEAEYRLAETLRTIRRKGMEFLCPASESLLATWGASWYGGPFGESPREGSWDRDSASGRGLVDAPCQDG